MPKLLHQSEIAMEWSDLERRVTHPREDLGSKRASGVHLSGVLKWLAGPEGLRLYANGQLDNEDMSELDAGGRKLKMFLGQAWEMRLAEQDEELHWQPGEVERDGVFGNFDGRKYAEGGVTPRIWECKFTYKTANPEKRPVLKEWLWMSQLLGYAAMDPAGAREAELHVCYAAGSYTYPLEPVYRKYVIGMSDEEVEGFWRNFVVKYKSKAVEEVH